MGRGSWQIILVVPRANKKLTIDSQPTDCIGSPRLKGKKQQAEEVQNKAAEKLERADVALMAKLKPPKVLVH